MRSSWLDDDTVYPPLGLLYLKSYLNSRGIDVTIDDNFDFKKPYLYSKYDLFGISAMTPQREVSNKFLNFCKDNFKADVVIGGPHALYYLDDVKKERWDYIVPGDGFKSLLKIIQGTANRVESNPLTKQEWQQLPPPDRSSKEAIELLCRYNYKLQGVDSTTMLTAVGCNQKCKFCEAASTNVKRSSVENIKKELDDIVNLGYKGVYLFDDLFALSLKIAKPICEEIHKRKLIYRCNGQAKYFNEEFAKMLKDTGCVEIAFGAESGSQQILDNINKGTTVKQNYKFVELCKKYDIFCKAFLMIGLPGETYETIACTEKFIKDTQLDDFQLSVFYPYKGTIIRDEIEQKGKSSGIYFEREGLGAYGQKGGSTEAVIRTETLSSRDLLRERDRLVNMYHPRSHKQKWTFFDTHLIKGNSI